MSVGVIPKGHGYYQNKGPHKRQMNQKDSHPSLFQVFQKLHRTTGFQERTDGFLGGYLTFSIEMRTVVIYKIRLFNFF